MIDKDFYFIGVQEGLQGESIKLYNLLVDIPGHPKGSTVSDITLRQCGYNVE